MDFSLSREQAEIVRAIRDLGSRGLNDRNYEDDEQAVFPRAKWDLCRSFGVQGLPIPEEHGGSGQGMLTTALAIQALASVCADEGLIFSLCAHLCMCAIPLWRQGTPEQKSRYLRKVATGEWIGGNAITEADAGSDLAGMRATAVKEPGGDGYVLNGAKLFVTNAPVADLLIVYARHPGGMKMLDISAFIVEKGAPGLAIGQSFRKMGLRSSAMSEVVLTDCRVPSAQRLGRERRGMTVFNDSMGWERILMSAYHLGAMQQQYGGVLEYANLRRQFGRKIIQFSGVSDKIIDMKARIETLELLLYKVCWRYDAEQAIDLADASMLKLLVSEAKVASSLDAVQIFGAYGYMKESPVEKQLRDSIAAKIYSGTSEIQRRIIAENLEGGDE